MSTELEEIQKSFSCGKKISNSKFSKASAALKTVQSTIENHRSQLNTTISVLTPVAGLKRAVKKIESDEKKGNLFLLKIHPEKL